MILWNYLAECQTSENTGLKAAMCISSPFDPVDSSLSIERFFPRVVFNRHLANGLKRLVTPYGFSSLKFYKYFLLVVHFFFQEYSSTK